MKLLLIFLGTLCLALGIAGIVVPGLPATPFFLLTAGLYVRSSENLYQKLLNSPFAGPYIKKYRANKGMTKSAKVKVLIFMWLMITLSCVFLIPSELVILIVLSTGVIGSIVMGFVVPTVNPGSSSKSYKTENYERKEKADPCVGGAGR
ncbi:MAG: YbaN family protein [Bacteroidales bacterium]